MKVGVLGAGAWGTALAISSTKVGNEVILWSHSGDVAHFDGIELSGKVKLTRDMSDLASVDTWLITTPAVYFRETLIKARPFYKGQPVIVCTKGIEASTHKFMSEIMDEELPKCRDYGVLSGPQFAKDVANGILTGSTLAGTKTAIEAGTEALKDLYLEASNDVIGVEICGVGKNAVALVTGFASIGIEGENKRALIFTLAWNEVVKFGLANGAKIETFLALCGLGDLYLSATSTTSRNYSAGIAIAKGEPIIGTVEGIAALNGLVHRGVKKGIDMPVLSDMREKANT